MGMADATVRMFPYSVNATPTYVISTAGATGGQSSGGVGTGAGFAGFLTAVLWRNRHAARHVRLRFIATQMQEDKNFAQNSCPLFFEVSNT